MRAIRFSYLAKLPRENETPTLSYSSSSSSVLLCDLFFVLVPRSLKDQKGFVGHFQTKILASGQYQDHTIDASRKIKMDFDKSEIVEPIMCSIQ